MYGSPDIRKRMNLLFPWGHCLKKDLQHLSFGLYQVDCFLNADHHGILAASELNYIVHIKLFAAEQPLPIGLRKSTIVTSGILF